MIAVPTDGSAQSQPTRHTSSHLRRSHLHQWHRALPAAALLLCMAAAPTITSAETLVAAAPVAASTKKPQIQVAVLLDTSNSMDGLINQGSVQK